MRSAALKRGLEGDCLDECIKRSPISIEERFKLQPILTEFFSKVRPQTSAVAESNLQQGEANGFLPTFSTPTTASENFPVAFQQLFSSLVCNQNNNNVFDQQHNLFESANPEMATFLLQMFKMAGGWPNPKNGMASSQHPPSTSSNPLLPTTTSSEPNMNNPFLPFFGSSFAPKQNGSGTASESEPLDYNLLIRPPRNGVLVHQPEANSNNSGMPNPLLDYFNQQILPKIHNSCGPSSSSNKLEFTTSPSSHLSENGVLDLSTKEDRENHLASRLGKRNYDQMQQNQPELPSWIKSSSSSTSNATTSPVNSFGNGLPSFQHPFRLKTPMDRSVRFPPPFLFPLPFNTFSASTLPKPGIPDQQFPAPPRFSHFLLPPAPPGPSKLPEFSPNQHIHNQIMSGNRQDMFLNSSSNNDEDDDWETMMEVSDMDEGQRIREIVGENPPKATDQNQCLICLRVLSCRSALQMHYRTHTGARPFKCKICKRAFTTKGNLKTHMGIHKSKAAGLSKASGVEPMLLPTSVEGVHLCPICQKQLPNALLLHEHLQQHQYNLVNNPHPLSSEGSFANLPGQMNMFFSPSVSSALSNSTERSTAALGIRPGHHSNFSPKANSEQFDYAEEEQPKNDDDSGISPSKESIEGHPNTNGATSEDAEKKSFCSRFSSNSPQEEDEKPLLSKIGLPPLPPFFMMNLCQKNETKFDENHQNDELTKNPNSEPNEFQEEKSPSPTNQQTNDNGRTFLQASSEQNIHHQQEIQATPESNEPENSNDIILSSAEHSVSSPVANDHLKAMQKMCTVEQTPRLKPTQIFNKHQCQCCCKVFSSSSALQIHRRTHTGERPFICEACSRPFTTRGNLKVHMSTHTGLPTQSRRGRRMDFSGDAKNTLSPHPHPLLPHLFSPLNPAVSLSHLMPAFPPHLLLPLIANGGSVTPQAPTVGAAPQLDPVIAAAFLNSSLGAINSEQLKSQILNGLTSPGGDRTERVPPNNNNNNNDIGTRFPIENPRVCPICQTESLNTAEELQLHIIGHFISSNSSADEINSEGGEEQDKGDTLDD